MFKTAKQLKACSLLASDGEIGRVKDLYFDTTHWTLRYFVVDAGKWADHRQVLISPESVYAPAWDQDLLPINLTRDQIRRSPGLETDQPVSRQYEAAMRKHYGLTPYWGLAYADALGGLPATAPSAVIPPPEISESELEGDPHLFSVNAVTGHHVAAIDGEIGHIDDFLFDEREWGVRYLLVATRNWLPGRKVILSPWWATDIDWPNRLLRVDLTRDAIKSAPPYDPEKALTMEAAGQLHDYYGRPRFTLQDQEAVADTILRSDNPNNP